MPIRRSSWRTCKDVVTIPVEALVLNAQQEQTVYVLDAQQSHSHSRCSGGPGRLEAGRDQRADSSPAIGCCWAARKNISEDEEVNPILASTPASETLHESGGMIDLKAGANGGRPIMPKFALRFPFFILMLCLIILLVGTVTVAHMPVDLFPPIDMPVVVVATFYNGMPPEQIEADITNTFERFFTLAANVDHSESRSLTGVSLIKIYFKPGTDPNAALSNIANLAMADLRRSAARNAAARGAGHDRFDAAGLPGHAERRGPE